MSNTTITVSQLLATPDGSFVNSPVEGYLVQIRPPSGKGPAKAKLQDGSSVIEASLWGGDCRQWEGKRVRMSGKGMKVTVYPPNSGIKQLSVGDKVSIDSAEAFAGVPSHPRGVSAPEPMPGDPTPSKAPTVSQSAPLSGALVGMAINRGVEIWLAQEGEAGARWDKTAIERVEEIARQLVEMSKRIETGSEIPF